MLPIIEEYASELNATEAAANYNLLWERGLLTYDEALKLIQESAEKNRFYYVIQYKGYNARKYHDFCETLYTWEEAKKELQRLKEAAPDFGWRTRKEYKY